MTKVMGSPFISPPSLLFYSDFPLVIFIVFCCCKFRVSCTEAKDSGENLHNEGNNFYLPLYFLPFSFTLLLLYWFANFYCSFVVTSLGFHAGRLGFDGWTSMRKVMDSTLLSSHSIIFNLFLYWFVNV